MLAKHPPESTPNRGYSYVGQESISTISGYDKGLPQGQYVRDIKVLILYLAPNIFQATADIDETGNCRPRFS